MAKANGAALKLHGKSLEQLRMALAGKSREELLALLAAAVAVEPLYKPGEIAALSKMRRRDVLSAIKAGKFGGYFLRGANSLAVPASGVNAYRASFFVKPTISKGAA